MKRIAKTTLISNIVIISLLMVFSIGVVAYLKYKNFLESNETIKKELIREKKLLMKTIVDDSIKRIEISQKASKKFYDLMLQQRVHNAYKIATYIYNKYKNRLSQKELKELIKNTLRPIRYKNEKGYIFIASMKGVEILYPVKPEYENKNILSLQDSRGNFVIKNEINLLKTKNEGFLDEYWIDYETNKEDKKRVFIKKFEPFNWYIGTGYYLSDITAELQEKAKNTLNQIRFGRNGDSYLYILDWENRGTKNQITRTVMHPVFGNNKIVDINEKGFSYRKKILDKLMIKNETFYLIPFRKIDDPRDYEKLIYMRYYPKWHWIIGTGVYLDDVERIAKEKEALLKKELIKEISILFLLFTLAMIIAFLISRKFYKNLNKIIDSYQEEIKKRENELQLLNLSLQERVEEKTKELKALNLDLEYRIKKATEEIEEKNRIILKDSTIKAQAEVLSMIAHQWRQPLNVISLLISNISLKKAFGELSDKDLEEGLEKISNDIQKLSSLIDKFSAVFGEVSLYEIEFRKIKQNIKEFIETKYQNSDMDFYISPKECDVKVLSSEKVLNDIFDHLIENAVDAVESIENKKIYVEFECDEESLYVSVIDNGIGINQEDRDKLFKAYFSTKSLNTSGLSLYMAKISLQNMNADIEYRPRSVGSEFVVKLPLIKE